jgi:hypothetical protein
MPELARGAFWAALRFHKCAHWNFVHVVRVHEKATVAGAAYAI